MTLKNKIIIGGAHMGQIILDNIKKSEFYGFLDDNRKVKNNIGELSDISKFKKKSFIIAIANPHIRARLFKYLIDNKFKLFNCISKFSHVSKSSKIGKGIFVDNFVKIYPFANINDGAAIFSHSAIGTYCKISENTIISPKCSFASNTSIGKNCFIGAGVTVQENIKIGNNCFIAAGEIVRINLANNKALMKNKVFNLTSKFIKKIPYLKKKLIKI